MDCGPTCLRMIAKHYGKSYSLQNLRNKSGISREGVSMLGIGRAAEALGFHTVAVKTSIDKLEEEGSFPFIAHWQQNHFVVVRKIKGDKVYIADPGKSLIDFSKKEFNSNWASTANGAQQEGIALLLEPSPSFYLAEEEKDNRMKFTVLFNYLWMYKRLLLQLLMGLVIGSTLQLIFPFLTQSIIDVGVNSRNIGFIYLILLAQLMLFTGQATIDFLRSWILLHINTRINVSILSDFLIKLMKLPISFFDSKMIGDIMQRMDDQQRIQSFLTGPALHTLFSFFNFFVFSIVIISYDIKIFSTFITGSVLYVLWVLLFLKRRKALDYKHFDIAAQNQGKVIQLINGMQEIKMNNCELSKRWEWERLQARLFKISIKALSLSQLQQGGAFFINQGKNILITFLSAKAVVDGSLSLGGMLAIQYIIGQLNSPLEQFINFIQSSQDAMISLERLNEIHSMPDEIPAESRENITSENTDNTPQILIIPSDKSIHLKDISFRYPGTETPPVLENISLHIPEGKTTAVVGTSGSGKTTLLKLLMKFYHPKDGIIKVGAYPLHMINTRTWRDNFGAVLQDNYIFSDTIANNIAISDEAPDPAKLLHAIRMANIEDFIGELPLGINTKIGVEGIGISQGQKQRILIARAIYKNPEYIFFDEATNALDTNNEKVIMENLESFFKGKTVVVVAHRLSTVKNADQIVVLHKGRLIESGTHQELIASKGAYYELVRNQLELGN